MRNLLVGQAGVCSASDGYRSRDGLLARVGVGGHQPDFDLRVAGEQPEQFGSRVNPDPPTTPLDTHDAYHTIQLNSCMPGFPVSARDF